jgi:hypothetical protein
MRSAGVQGALKLPIHQSKQRQKKRGGLATPSRVLLVGLEVSVILSHKSLIESLNILKE